MDRCYRIGQKKDVFVKFFDCGGSLDEVMAILNTYKSSNAKVVLADGTDLGTHGGGGLSYQELNGLLSRAMMAVAGSRSDHLNKHGRTERVPGTSNEIIQAVLHNTTDAVRELLGRMSREGAGGDGDDAGDGSIFV